MQAMVTVVIMGWAMAMEVIGVILLVMVMVIHIMVVITARIDTIMEAITLIMDMNIMVVMVIMEAMDIIIPITQVTIMAIHIIEMQIMEKGRPLVPDPRDMHQQIPLFATAMRIKQRVRQAEDQLQAELLVPLLIYRTDVMLVLRDEVQHHHPIRVLEMLLRQLHVRLP